MAKVKIKELRLRNFRAFENVRFVLDDELTVLLGRNGAGKTTIMEAFDFLRDALTEGLTTAVERRFGLVSISHPSKGKGSITELSIAVILSIDSEEAMYGFTLNATANKTGLVKSEYLSSSVGYFTRSATQLETNVNNIVSVPDEGSLLFPLVAGINESWLTIYDVLKKMLVYSISPEMIKLGSTISNDFRLDRDGMNAGNVLRNLQGRDYTIEDLITAIVRANVIPFDQGIQPKKPKAKRSSQQPIDIVESTSTIHSRHEYASRSLEEGINEDVRWILDYLGLIAPGIEGVYNVTYNTRRWVEFEQNFTRRNKTYRNSYRPESISNGTLRAFCILLALKQKPIPALVFIDEIEDSLHPEAISVLFEAISETAKYFQVVITTHSPQVLDNPAIKPEAVRVVEWHEGVSWVYPLHRRVVSYLKKEEAMGEMFTMDMLRTADAPLTIKDDDFFKLPPPKEEKKTPLRRKQAASSPLRAEEQPNAA